MHPAFNPNVGMTQVRADAPGFLAALDDAVWPATTLSEYAVRRRAPTRGRVIAFLDQALSP